MDLNNITTILDRQKHEQIAWRRTLDLQKRAGSRVEAVSFVYNAMCESHSVLSADERKKLKNGLIEERKDWLEGLVSDSKNVKTRTVWDHDIAQWVEDRCEKKPPDLIVKTAHKSGSVIRTPTDWELLNTCKVPVLLTNKRRGKTGGNVLAALDLNRTDRKHRHLNCNVLEAAHVFAELYNAKVHVVFAVEISQVLRDLNIVNEKLTKAKIVEKVTPELERLLKPYDIPGARVHMPVGKVGRVVSESARKLKADLLVVGSFAHRAKQIVGLGNSAERILGKSTCDVLAVHP